MPYSKHLSLQTISVVVALLLMVTCTGAFVALTYQNLTTDDHHIADFYPSSVILPTIGAIVFPIFSHFVAAPVQFYQSKRLHRLFGIFCGGSLSAFSLFAIVFAYGEAKSTMCTWTTAAGAGLLSLVAACAAVILFSKVLKGYETRYEIPQHRERSTSKHLSFQTISIVIAVLLVVTWSGLLIAWALIELIVHNSVLHPLNVIPLATGVVVIPVIGIFVAAPLQFYRSRRLPCLIGILCGGLLSTLLVFVFIALSLLQMNYELDSRFVNAASPVLIVLATVAASATAVLHNKVLESYKTGPRSPQHSQLDQQETLSEDNTTNLA